MWQGTRTVVIAVIAVIMGTPCVGCGPEKESSADGGQDAPDPDVSTMPPGSSSTATATETDTMTATETVDTGVRIWEGVTIYVESYPDDRISFVSCEDPDEWYCIFPNDFFPPCGGAHVRVRAHLVPVSWGIDGGCDPWALQVDEVLEVRGCEPGACGQPDLCRDDQCAHGCSPLAASSRCTAAERCVLGPDVPGLDADWTRCVDKPEDPLRAGEPCRRSTFQEFDQCARGLTCWSPNPEAAEGTCVSFCRPDDPESCDQTCKPCERHRAGLCLCETCELGGSC